MKYKSLTDVYNATVENHFSKFELEQIVRELIYAVEEYEPSKNTIDSLLDIVAEITGDE